MKKLIYLTKSQIDLLNSYAGHSTIQEMAEDLETSYNAVRGRMRALRNKLGGISWERTIELYSEGRMKTGRRYRDQTIALGNPTLKIT